MRKTDCIFIAKVYPARVDYRQTTEKRWRVGERKREKQPLGVH